MDTEHLKALSKKIISDPAAIGELTAEEALDLRKYLNPLGNIATAKKSYVNLNITNWHDRFLRKLHVTGLIGFIYRALYEYEPEDLLEKEKIDLGLFGRDAPNIKPGPARDAALAAYEKRAKVITDTSRGIIQSFLNKHFKYNPDQHLRTAHKDGANEKLRQEVADIRAAAINTAAKSADYEAKFADKPEVFYKYMRGHLLTTNQAVTDTIAAIKNALSALDGQKGPGVDDARGILLKQYRELLGLSEDLKKTAGPISKADTIYSWRVDPPAEVYYHYDRFLSNHFEELSNIVESLYAERKDIEYAVILHDAFDTQEAAEDHIAQHNAEFTHDVFTVESGAVTLLGPFKQNRERINFYNKNTEILKIMQDQLKLDHEYGGDLVDKIVSKKKKKNIMEAGPDDPALTAYAKTVNQISSLGARKVLSKEEMRELEEAKITARNIREDYEVPDEAIQVDVFFPKETEAGGVELSRTNFYTQAEVPDMSNDPNAPPFQPKRKEGEKMSIPRQIAKKNK